MEVVGGDKYEYFVGGIVYKNSNLDFISTAEGRYNNVSYEYNLNDHLGNLRVSFSCLGGIIRTLQTSHQDPWGLNLPISTNAGAMYGVKANRYKFQGQEEMPETGYVQFKWRLHDPYTGRFNSLDPISEKYYYNSPYAFSENKVTAHIELEGLEAVRVIGVQTPYNCHYCSKTGLINANYLPTSMENPRADVITAGVSNTTFGALSTAGLLAAPETFGVSAVVPLILSLGEMTIGTTQVIDGVTNQRLRNVEDGKAYLERSVLHKSSSLIGLPFYQAKSSYAGYANAFGQFATGFPGNILGIRESFIKMRKARKIGESLFHGLSGIDAFSDTNGLWEASKEGKTEYYKSEKKEGYTKTGINELKKYIKELPSNKQ